MKDFKIFKSLLFLSSSLSCLLVGVAVSTIAGCNSKRKSNLPECKKYPAWKINPSTPVPKPKPKPKKDAFEKILLKHSDWYNPFLLDWDKKLIMETFPSSVIRDYLIKNLAPKLKYDYSKINFIGGKEEEKGKKPIIWNAIIQNDITKITALFLTTPYHHIGIDFWVLAETKK